LISVGVVASNLAMRIGLREVINNLPEINVVTTAGCIDELQPDIPDVLIVVPPANIQDLKEPMAVLYLSDDPNVVRDLFNLDFTAWGALSVNASEDELNIAIHALAEGLWIGTPSLVQKWFVQKPVNELSEIEELSILTLTQRETEVLQLAAEGLANKQIAVRLGISEHTIKFHLSSLYAKLSVSSRTEAIRRGVRFGLVVL
jgi:two-component system, NarL family, response regulator YdfI